MRVTVLATHLSILLAGSLASAPSTCQFRTANYITHGLPQQCLATGISPETLAHPRVGVNGSLEDTLSVREDKGGFITSTLAPEDKATGTATTTTTTTTIIQTTTTITTATGTATAGHDDKASSSDDGDSALDSDPFLSFEEWKKRNLAQAGQDAQNLGDRGIREPRRRPGGMNNDIDSIGEDAEIDLNFGFDTAFDKPKAKAQDAGSRTVSGEKPAESVAPRGLARNKMAGKTSKERFNYASFDCAATVHKTNKGVKGQNSILVENKDSYMLNKCAEKEKFFIVELCDDILVDTIALANFEFFSSMFRQFRVSVSDRYPIKASGWRELGVFEGRNSREVQAFLVENPLIWARYLKVEILSHYGNEYYCPLSLLRVHGTTMMEEFKAQEEAARGLVEDDVEEVVPEAVAADLGKPKVIDTVPKPAVAEEPLPLKASPTPEHSVQVGNALQTVPPPAQTIGPTCAVPPVKPVFRRSLTSSTCSIQAPATSLTGSLVYAEFYTSIPAAISITSQQAPPTGITSVTHDRSSPSAKAPERTDTVKIAEEVPKEHKEQPVKVQQPPATVQHHPPPPQVTTQENFFKTIHKRLQLLEANATLSLQYIEEQSRLLRDAFSKIESRQNRKTTQFVESLNSTVWKELVGFRKQYDQLWQSTVIALESQKSQSESDLLELNQQLALLAEEVLSQRRMGYIQSSLLLVCILLIIFRQNYTLENPLVHSLRTKGMTSGPLRFLESPPTSPSPNQGSPLPHHQRRSHHRHTSSMDSYAAPDIDFTPPTPESQASRSRQGTPAQLAGEGKIVRSSPATPRGNRDNEDFEWNGGSLFGPQGGKKGKKKRKGSPLKRRTDDGGGSGGRGGGGSGGSGSEGRGGSAGEGRRSGSANGSASGSSGSNARLGLGIEASSVWEFTP